MYSASTYDVMKSYLTRVWDKNWLYYIGNKDCYVINAVLKFYHVAVH